MHFGNWSTCEHATDSGINSNQASNVTIARWSGTTSDHTTQSSHTYRNGHKTFVRFVYFRVQNVTDQIYSAIKDMVSMLGGSRTVKISDVMERCTTKGFKPDAIDACIDEYEELNVWQVNQKRDKITFLWVLGSSPRPDELHCTALLLSEVT